MEQTKTSSCFKCCCFFSETKLRVVALITLHLLRRFFEKVECETSKHTKLRSDVISYGVAVSMEYLAGIICALIFRFTVYV